mgnify:FL=1
MKKTENAAQACPATHNQFVTVILALVMALALTFAIAIIPSAHAVEGVVAPIQTASTPTGPAVPIENTTMSASTSAAEAIADEETPLASFAKEESQFSWAQVAVLVAVLAVVAACGLTVVKRRRDEVRRLDCFESHVSGR